MKLTVVIPTYNEAANLRAITAALLALPIPDLDILIVDDDSPDGTGALADEMSRALAPRFRVLHRPAKSGLGTAYIQGFLLALQNGAEYVAQMDADFSHSPNYLAPFLAQSEQYDVIVGSRYVRGGKLDERWSFGRYLLSWWANSVYVRLILGLQVHDATAGFKLWRRAALEKINLAQVRSNGYIFQVEMAYLSEQHGLRILEYPIYFEDRRIGQSKMSMRVKWEAASRVWEIRSRYGRMRNRSAYVTQQFPATK
ncbi:MAG: polyprenol monophosphomannose synthase [Chloroflexi bacterium UTCFX4]|jgi:dolichol-phosphate mannosyltransferase|nr:MAG: polyprenol monophosphomannose synthase [Chloroflexi bacterium UTCFX4]